MSPPHEVVSGQRWPCSPCSRACCRPVSAQGLCRVRVRFWCWSRVLWCTPAPKFPHCPPWSHPPPQPPRAHAHGPRSTHTSPPRTHARLGAVPAGLGEDVWARKPFFSSCLLPPAGSSGHRERARASLLPHLEHTRAGQARCTPRSLVQTLKVA